jgi:glycerol-3-phosphate dehydrogenase
VRDRFTGDEGHVSAGVFVNAAGPWADVLAGTRGASPLRLTRGTHVVLDRAPDGDARLFFSPRDARALFLLPWENGTSLLSTTDLDEPAPSQEPIPREEEIRYLREAFLAQFPDWKRWRPLGAQCGLRPLLAGDGDPSSLSREERILVDPARSLVSILGGKYTTFRAVAERATDEVERSLGRSPVRRPTRDRPIPASAVPADSGARIRRAFAEEDAVRLEDVFLRRTSLGLQGPVDRALLDLAEKLWRLRWGKGEAEAGREREAFLDLQARRSAPLAAWKP